MNKWMNGWMNEKWMNEWMNEYNVEWVEVRKMSEVFRGKLYCKMSDFFASFRWLWDFLQENLKLIDKLQIRSF